MILPELEEVYTRYLKKGNSREYNRFIHFSSFIVRTNSEYIKNYNNVEEWLNSQRRKIKKGEGMLNTIGLKNVDVYSILEYFASIGLPECHTVAKRFSECLRIWLAAYWEIYGPILKSAIKVKTERSSQIKIYLSEESIMTIASKTGITLSTFFGFNYKPKERGIQKMIEYNFFQSRGNDLLEKYSIQNLLNFHPNMVGYF